MKFAQKLTFKMPGLYKNFLSIPNEVTREIPEDNGEGISVDLIYKPKINIRITSSKDYSIEEWAEIRALEFYIKNQKIEYSYEDSHPDAPHFEYKLDENKVSVSNAQYEATYQINDIAIVNGQLKVDMIRVKG